MNYDIEFINTKKPNVDYSDRAASTDYDDEHYTTLFEGRLVKKLTHVVGEDIGGLIVYSKENKLVAVYDYENYTGWYA
jgi:hypothetical protein